MAQERFSLSAVLWATHESMAAQALAENQITLEMAEPTKERRSFTTTSDRSWRVVSDPGR
ncbi:unnamed protein product, partial [Heterosigma akashiwo]